MKGTNERWPADWPAKDGDKYRVTEIFETLQGEGANIGTPITLVRFAKCNLACSFCDTDFDRYTSMSIRELEDAIAPDRAIMVTGGEPMLQLDTLFVRRFKGDRGQRIFVETSGTVRPLYNGIVDWLVVSPKSPKVDVRPHEIHELRVPVGSSTRIDYVATLLAIPARVYFVSPIFGDNGIEEGAMDRCYEIQDRWPHVRLSVQLHKLMGWK